MKRIFGYMLSLRDSCTTMLLPRGTWSIPQACNLHQATTQIEADLVDLKSCLSLFSIDSTTTVLCLLSISFAMKLLAQILQPVQEVAQR